MTRRQSSRTVQSTRVQSTRVQSTAMPSPHLTVVANQWTDAALGKWLEIRDAYEHELMRVDAARRRASTTMSIATTSATSIATTTTTTLSTTTTLRKARTTEATLKATTAATTTHHRVIVDPAHPAHGQHGLFAKRRLEARAHVCDYVGRVHTEFESDPRSNYDVRFVQLPHGKGEFLSIDAQHVGGTARFINDYRGVRARPNVEFREYYDWKERTPHLGVFVMAQAVERGDELVVTYGKGFWEARRECCVETESQMTDGVANR